MATHASVLTLGVPQTVDPGGLQSMGHKRVGHELVTTQQLDTTDYNKELRQWQTFVEVNSNEFKTLLFCS